MKKIIILAATVCSLFLLSGNAISAGQDPNSALKEAYQSKDFRKVFSISSDYAKKGDAAGQYILGQLYLNGRGVQKNPAIAFSWLKKAADQHHPLAQFAIGTLYATGEGTRKDMTSKLIKG